MTPITLETYPGSRKKGLINLIECGYNTLEMVSETDDDVLLRYRNVGPVLIADLRKMAMDHGIQITGKPTKPSYKRLEAENAALRAAGDKLRDALISELKDVQAVAEMFGDPNSPHVKKLTAVIEQWNAARKEAQP
jgi:hypothetical protein